MNTFYTTITQPDGGVSLAVVIPRPNAYQDDADWGVVPPAPRLLSHEPDPRDAHMTSAELMERSRREQFEIIMLVEQREANMAYDHLPTELSHLITHQPGLMPLQCRVCLEACASLTDLARHTGKSGGTRCPVLRTLLANTRAELEENENNDWQPLGAASAA